MVSDPSLFVHRRQTHSLYLLLYVDDIIITDSSLPHLNTFISNLSSKYALKDLGDLHYFFGIEVHHTSYGLFLSQSAYTHDLLAQSNMLHAKPVATPMATTTPSIDDSSTFNNPTHFCSLAGALQYLTLTHPNIEFSVNYICQFMHSPTNYHYSLLHRILHYIAGTIYLGSRVLAQSSFQLSGYSDAD